MSGSSLEGKAFFKKPQISELTCSISNSHVQYPTYKIIVCIERAVVHRGNATRVRREYKVGEVRVSGGGAPTLLRTL